jgi:membrane-associated protease RseP (regulator of RpoE activity)
MSMSEEDDDRNGSSVAPRDEHPRDELRDEHWMQPQFGSAVADARPDWPPTSPPISQLYWPPQPRSLRSLAVAVALFLLTALSTLAAGSQFAVAYAAGHAPNFDEFFSSYFQRFTEPRLLLAGIPFAATLMVILLAHELGHYFACRHYHIWATYPYFIPAPTLIGTMGAFIRIRSPIVNRRALFDMALAGPLVGFLFAVPALAVAILHSKIVFAADTASSLTFGQPLVERLLEALLRPGLPHANLLLHPIGRAAWVGLFATALNLLPSGQLDGGHILYSLTNHWHRRISLGVALALVPLAYFWWGWLIWAVLLVAIGFRHPQLIDPWEPLDRRRRILAVAALAIFVLVFMPAPLAV